MQTVLYTVDHLYTELNCWRHKVNRITVQIRVRHQWHSVAVVLQISIRTSVLDRSTTISGFPKATPTRFVQYLITA